MLIIRKNPLFIEVTTEVSAVVSGGITHRFEAEGKDLYIVNHGKKFVIYKSGGGDKQENGLYQNVALLALP